MTAPLRIAVTGANGFIGAALCDALQSAGLQVRRITRKLQAQDLPVDDRGLASGGVDAVAVGDIDATTDWTQALHGCKVVIHLAAHQSSRRSPSNSVDLAFDRVNTRGTLNLVTQAAEAGVERFLFLSTIKVHGEVTQPGHAWVETTAPNPQDLYSQSKWQAETALIAAASASGMEWVIIRPPAVYGPTQQRSNIRSLARWVAQGVPLPLGAIKNQRSMIALPNLVDVIVRCTTHAQAVNQIFVVSDDHDLSLPELIQKMAARLNTKARLIPVPLGLLKICAAAIGQEAVMQRLTGNLQVDISKVKEILGWSPPFSVDDGLCYLMRGDFDKEAV